MNSIQELESFDIRSLPDLDVCVLGALDLFIRDGLPVVPTFPSGKALVVGSGNAAVTARVLASSLRDAEAADESEYLELLAKQTFSYIIIISASGAKHAVGIAKEAKERNIPAFLLTHVPNPPAGEYLKKEHIFTFPKNREPYTYNTSTYLGIILALTKEDPKAIRSFIMDKLAPAIPNDLSMYDSYFVTVPVRFHNVIPMLRTKFDELFGPKISCRAYTIELAKHATTVVPSEKEYFLNLGEMPHTTQNEKVHFISLPEHSGFGMIMSTLYFFVGNIQKQNPPHFKANIEAYCEKASSIFGQQILPIVE